MSTRKTTSSDRLAQWQEHYSKLKQSLTSIGYICPGSVVERYMPCGKPTCRCTADPANRHGPYYEWSRKVKGKTVTVRLSEPEASVYKELTMNDRTCNKLFHQMRKISMQIATTMIREIKK